MVERKIEAKHIVESALFSAGRPLEVAEIAEACELRKDVVRKSLKELIKDYSDRTGSIEIAKVGGKYAMQLRSGYARHAARLAQMEIPAKVLKTAALIAYYQPVAQSELKKLLGSKIYDHVGALHQLGLIRTRKTGALPPNDPRNCSSEEALVPGSKYDATENTRPLTSS